MLTATSWNGQAAYSFGPKMDGSMAKITNGDIVPFAATAQ